MADPIYMISGLVADAIEDWDGYDSVGKPLGSVSVGFEHFLAANIVNSPEFQLWLNNAKADAWDAGRRTDPSIPNPHRSKADNA